MTTGRQVAGPGDVCVLLEPDEDELLSVRRLQTSLQALIGGRPHQRIHLTCQRFSVGDDHHLASVADQLRSRVAPLPPVAVTVAGFVVLESPFWQTRLLRWQVEVTDELRRLITAVEAGLAAAGVTPHFPSAVGAPATPPHITLRRRLWFGRLCCQGLWIVGGLRLCRGLGWWGAWRGRGGSLGRLFACTRRGTIRAGFLLPECSQDSFLCYQHLGQPLHEDA